MSRDTYHKIDEHYGACLAARKANDYEDWRRKEEKKIRKLLRQLTDIELIALKKQLRKQLGA